ncbi:MAG: TonB-dependent receptor [Hydrocarboniphaga sp.]|uniref:TonB-dependent receptor n=1 Tax=Hydrocarboniphaga sp. TaxID=2033016 RepID=UPI002630162F|nr:TonB-dependent receptor [Hydrocarboniphaga sp.]MDB5968609.1 TonB-dependent receptor [Hydrocarboniphaga sp.]
MKQGFNLEFGVRPVVATIRGRRSGMRAAAMLLLTSAAYAGVALARDPAAAPPAAAEVQPIALPATDAPPPTSETQGNQAAVPAQAETRAAPEVAADQSTSGIEEVVVTARRREESAQSVPIAITALSGDALETHHINNIEGLATVVPTLSISQSSGRENSPVYSLRGIRPTESLYGQDPTVAIYFADAVLSPAEGTNLGMYDLASVQVLKGPQGTLFGRNTTGGAILLTPRRPGNSFGADIMVGYGSYGLNETQVGVDIPASDTFALRLSGRTINSEGYQTNVAPGPLYGSKLGGEDTRSVRLSAVWNPTDSIENYMVVMYDQRHTNGRGMVLKAANPDPSPLNSARCYDGPGNPVTGGQPCNRFETTDLPSIYDAVERANHRDINDVESDMRQFENLESSGVVNTTSIKLGDELTLKGIGAYHDFKTAQSIDLDASGIPGELTAEGDEALHHASYELQLLGTAFDQRLNWVTGLYWYYETGFQNSPGRVSEGASGSNPFSQYGAVKDTSYSAFAQGSYNLTSDLSLTAGVRMNKDEREMTLETHTPTVCILKDQNGQPLTLDNCSVTLSDSFSQPTGTVSLDYKLRPDSLVYLASRLGYRSGGFNLRATNPLTYEPYKQETVNDLELGTKTDWSVGSWRMRSNADTFYQLYDDIQRTVGVTSTTGVPGSAVQNAAKAKVFGIELEQTIAPTRNLSLQLNYAYTYPKYDQWTEIGSDPVDPTATTKVYPVVDLSKTPFHFTPKHSGSATLAYTVPLGTEVGQLNFTSTASYRSGVWINSLQTIQAINRTPENIRPFLQQKAYWLLDLSAGWSGVMGTSFDVNAYAKNVTDEEYKVGGIQLYESAYASVSRQGLLTAAYGPPLTYGLQLRYRF